MSFDIGTLRGHFCFFLELFQKTFFPKNYHLWVSRESARRTWLMSTYIDHPHLSKKKSWQKKLVKKQKKTKVDIWALSFCINHLNICITIADFDITESGVLIWFFWVLKSTISPLKKCKIWTLRGNISETEQNEPQKNYCWLCVTHQTEHFWKHRKNFTRYVLGPQKSRPRISSESHGIGWGSLGHFFRMSQTIFLTTPVGLR